MKKVRKKDVVILFIIAFALMQFKTIDKTNPEIIPENDLLVMTNAPVEVKELMHEVCYDCHSHQVRYPWYSNIAPVSWWMKGHIENGMEKANYATWNAYSQLEKDSILARSSRLVGLKWKPIITYKITHGEARLDEAQREMLINYFDGERSDL